MFHFMFHLSKSALVRCAGRGVALLFLLCLANQADAHPFPPDITVANLKIHYKQIEMTLNGPSVEMLAPAGVQAFELHGGSTPKPIMEKLTKWLPTVFTLEKDEKPLAPETVSANFQNSSDPNATTYLLTVHYATESPAEKLRVASKFVHTVISYGGIQFELQADGKQTRDFDTKANLLNVWNNVVDFFQMGMNHLFTGPDHILFICTLIFALMSFKGVVKMLTGFTVGHSITLILSTFNVIHISPRVADIGIALTIIYVGLENILSKKDVPPNRWVLVFCFGLVHGMSFSSALREVGLPQQGLVLCLLAFNLGIEFAQIVIVAVVYPVLSRLRWRNETLDSENGTRKFKTLMNYGSVMTACMGFYWLFDRVAHP